MFTNRKLARDAKNKGICEEWHEKLRSTKDIKLLADMYFKGIDFCLSNEFPSNEFIKNNFKGKIEQYGIFLDEKNISLENKRKFVALGSCTGIVKYNGFSVSELFVKHDSVIEILSSGNSFVVIDVFDSAKINVESSGTSRVCINRYGGIVNVKETEDSKIKIIEKNKPTY